MNMRNDYRSEPIRRMVVMGESNAYGMNAVCAENEWVQTLGNQIRDLQDGPLRIFNHAIPSNVISPDAPGYTPGDAYRTSPSALERYEEDMISYNPDLAVFAYGLNDSRCGHSTESFMKAYRTIVLETRARCPDALILLAGPYWNPQYDPEAWEALEHQPDFHAFGRKGDDLVTAYNQAISDLAEEVGAVFVDLYSMLKGASWLIGHDACHFMDVGQRVIGMRIFCELAANCSFLSHSSKQMETELQASVQNTGGTNALPHVITTWRPPETSGRDPE